MEKSSHTSGFLIKGNNCACDAWFVCFFTFFFTNCAFCRPSTPRNVVFCDISRGFALWVWKPNSADMVSSWHQSFMLCCLSLLTGAEIILCGINRSPTTPINQTASLPGPTVLIRHRTRSNERKVTPTKPPARIFSTRPKPTKVHFGTEDLEEKIKPNLEKWVWGKGEEDGPNKLGKII